jgi:cobalamin biosynthesis Mg chelatase CobN
MPSSGLLPEQYKAINGYFSRVSEENCFNMLLHIANMFFSIGNAAAPYVETPREGLYLPGGILSEQEEKAYLIRARSTDRPVIGVVLHSSHIISGNLKAADALINALSSLGAFPLPVFSTLSADPGNARSGVRYALDKYFSPSGGSIVKCIVVTTGFSVTYAGYAGEISDELSTSIFEKWGVPVLQAMTTHYTLEQYEEKPQASTRCPCPYIYFSGNGRAGYYRPLCRQRPMRRQRA